MIISKKTGFLRRIFLSGAGIASALILVMFIAGCGMNSPELKIYAVKYGESMFPEQYVFHDSPAGKTMPFSWLFYYIEYKEKKILIDTGFNNPKYIKLFSIKNYIKPSDILRQNNVRPEDITDIIITHGHFDHADGIDSFPGAKIIISDVELELIKKGVYGQQTRNKFLKHKSVREFKGTCVLYNIFTLKMTGGHTAGSSVVFIDYKNLKYCLTGDEVYTKDNLDRGIMNGTVTSAANNLKFIKNYNKEYIPLTFHNPEYHGLRKNFIRITAD